ncbi:hypothetical protein KIW84_061880 [Lathyrus oleraceus]|uniref:Thylakoid membrane protein TERC, chloroplastic n=1 Tax=Pisum sativum TaxID=3888 RepID=A0A9D4W3N6_PEA|nr:hypothetical protein KIW84_061880 [Pisum sativum]
MGLASVVQIPLNHNGVLRIRVSSSLNFLHHPISSLSSVDHFHRPLRLQVSCPKPIRQVHPFHASEVKRITAQPKDEISSTEESQSSAVRTVALWVFAAVAFGVGLGFKEGYEKASEFFAGYILEQSLSVDNLFVFVLIFKYFKVPALYQNRVLSYGIAGAVVFRLTIILLGTATIQLFASEDEESDLSDNFLVKTCQKLIPVTTNYDGNKFITKQDGIWMATPLLLTVAVIELSDIAFAVDSIPAVFGVTRDPFIVFSSNLFAILGLRSLYLIISEGMSELKYLQPSIAVVLGFIGCKMILDYFGIHVSTEASLGFVASSLSIGVILSLANKSD